MADDHESLDVTPFRVVAAEMLLEAREHRREAIRCAMGTAATVALYWWTGSGWFAFIVLIGLITTMGLAAASRWAMAGCREAIALANERGEPERLPLDPTENLMGRH